MCKDFNSFLLSALMVVGGCFQEELKAEKLKAKDESEDLAQEMAELRYELTCLLEEERKRRASIEQASLRRIAELEAQVRILNNIISESSLAKSK